MAKTIVTHDGKFHADDVFAVAALLLLHPDANVVRTRDSAKIASGDMVVDVGGIYDQKSNRFDHHQIGGAGTHAGQAAIPYGAFGLVWKKFGETFSGKAAVAERVEKVLVTPIDANDNGIDLAVPKSPDLSPYEVSDAVRAFIPTWLEGDKPVDDFFSEAVLCAKRVIEREIKRAEALVAGEEKVKEVYKKAADKRLIVLDEDYSWKDILSKFPEPLYVVHPQSETWRIYCVRDNPHLFQNRKDLPESWAGLRDTELSLATGVSDVVFCHRNRFMAVARSKEGALELAKQALAA